jgi:hypothetical protein
METKMNDMITAFNTRLNEGHNGPGKNGWCTDSDLFKEILAAFPNAPVKFVARNFNLGHCVRYLEIQVPGLGDIDRAYFEYAPYIEFFPVLEEWTAHQEAKQEENHAIGARQFWESGEELATLLKRQVHVLHWYGSGDQMQASFKYYGPFEPKS